MKWQGVWVAIVTPFSSGKVDRVRLGHLVDRLLDAGINGICPCGTTGEGSSLEEEEFSQVVQTVLEKTGSRIPVVAGTGSNNTEHTVHRTQLAKSLGCTGALVVTPYYVKPTQEGLYRHFSTVGDRVGLPMMLYNVPGRTAVNMLPETVERLTQGSPVAAIKECASLPQVAELISRVGDRASIFSGEDGVLVPFLALGGHGVVSVASNVVPERFVSIFKATMAGKWDQARKEFFELRKLLELLFVESNPIPVKAAVSLLGLMEDEIRSPLAPISEANKKKLLAELTQLGLVKK